MFQESVATLERSPLVRERSNKYIESSSGKIMAILERGGGGALLGVATKRGTTVYLASTAACARSNFILSPC